MNSSYSGTACPVAEVLDEAPGIVGPAGHEGSLARRREVPFDPPLDEGDLLGRERAAHTHGAVAAERFDERGIHVRGTLIRQSAGRVEP